MVWYLSLHKKIDDMKVSIILPTFNEVGNILELIQDLRRILSESYDLEIIVVDDGSTDGTRELLSGDGSQLVDFLICRDSDRGLAQSLHAGISIASGDQILVMDTDFTHDPEEALLMLELSEHFDIVSGSRFAQGGTMSNSRHYMASFLFNMVLRLILRTQVQDNTGGYWTAKTTTIRRLPLDVVFKGFGEYYFRLLFLSFQLGASIVEVPSHYGKRRSGQSKANFIKMIFTYSKSAITFRIKIRNAENQTGLN